MSEEQITRKTPEPEGQVKDYIEYERNQDNRTWVQGNEKRIRQSLLNSRSFWQLLVDWAHKFPIPYAAIAISAPLLITGALLLSVFFGGMPFLFMGVGAGCAILLSVLVSVGVALGKTSDEFISDFCSALRPQYADTYTQKERKDPLDNALNSMESSVRAAANKIIEEQKTEFDNKEYEVPLGIQAKEKMRKIFEGIPDDFPLAKDFKDSDIARCKINEEKSGIRFIDSYATNIGNNETTCENKVNFFINFMEAIFGIQQLECRKGKEADWRGGISKSISGSYKCEITGDHLTPILNANVQATNKKVKDFYRQWKAKKLASESGKSNLISALEEWAGNDKTSQEIIKKIKEKLMVIAADEKIFEATSTIQTIWMHVSKNNLDRITTYMIPLQSYLNSKFGEGACQITNQSTQSTESHKEKVKFDFKIPVRLVEEHQQVDVPTHKKT